MPLETPSDPPPEQDWHNYVRGGYDREGRIIDDLYAADDRYVIYFSECELYYQASPELLKELGDADASCAIINRLLPVLDEITERIKESYRYKLKFSTLQLVADAYEMIFCGHPKQGLTILNGIRDKLQTSAEGKRRLCYQAGAVVIALLVWIAYFFFHWFVVRNPQHWVRGAEPWLLAAALAIAGGTFSVCLNIDSLPVSVNQQVSFLLIAGATRSVVALLAGTGLLLAMRAKMLAGLAYNGAPPVTVAPLETIEMFFCFLAGFSEKFVPNILHEAEKHPDGEGVKPSPALQATQVTDKSQTAAIVKADQAEVPRAAGPTPKADKPSIP
jgi:hypothetical protein